MSSRPNTPYRPRGFFRALTFCFPFFLPSYFLLPNFSVAQFSGSPIFRFRFTVAFFQLPFLLLSFLPFTSMGDMRTRQTERRLCRVTRWGGWVCLTRESQTSAGRGKQPARRDVTVESRANVIEQ